MNKREPYCLLGARTSGREADGGTSGEYAANRHAATLPRFRGVLLCRRCESCGTRISFKGESTDKLVLKCPDCQREYVFFDRK